MDSTLPQKFINDYFLLRRLFVKKIVESKSVKEIRNLMYEVSPLLSPMVATYGPAGLNNAPFMLTFVPKEEYLEDVLSALEAEITRPSKLSIKTVAELLLRTVYNPDIVDLSKLASHLMNKGHTYVNVKATGEATIGILIPPDKGAYELRCKAEIIEDGPIYRYVNIVHDLMHVAPHGGGGHGWCPAIIFTIKEIYDNHYKVLGKKIYP